MLHIIGATIGGLLFGYQDLLIHGNTLIIHDTFFYSYLAWQDPVSNTAITVWYQYAEIGNSGSIIWYVLLPITDLLISLSELWHSSIESVVFHGLKSA